MSLLERRRALMSLNKEKYVFVEYIQGTGTQWIDTGYIPSNKTSVFADFQFLSYAATSTLFGVRGNGSSAYQNMYVVWIRNNKFELSHGAQLNTSFATADTNRHTLSKNTTSVVFDENIQGFPSATFTSPYSLEIFACNNNGAEGSWCSNMKLYSLKIYEGGTNTENGTLVKDFVPCYRKSDRVGGLYDLVEGKFYENQGTGEFLIGGEI